MSRASTGVSNQGQGQLTGTEPAISSSDRLQWNGAATAFSGRSQWQSSVTDNSVRNQRPRLRQSTATVACGEHGTITSGSFRES
jgi:hypothetical protein